MKKLFLILVFCVVKITAQNTYVVTSANDPADPFLTVSGELRWAIEQANAHSGHDIITFNIGGNYNAPITILLNSNLPVITDAITIDGNTQNLIGYTGNEPKIIIEGINIPLSTIPGVYRMGLVTRFGLANGSIFSNLQLNNFKNAFRTEFSSNNSFTNNVCKNNGEAFYNADGSSNNVYKGNYINTDHSLLINSLYYSDRGIFIIGGGIQNNNIVGGTTNIDERNYIYNCNLGVEIQGNNSIENSILNNVFVGNTKNITLYYQYPLGCANTCIHPPSIQAYLMSGTTVNVQGSGLGVYNVIEIYKTNSGGIDANPLLKRLTVDPSGNIFSSINGLTLGDKLIATTTDPQGNTSEFSAIITVNPPQPCQGVIIDLPDIKNKFCTGSDVRINALECNNSTAIYNWSFGDGLTAVGSNVQHTYQFPGPYTIQLTVVQIGVADIVVTKNIFIDDCVIADCKDCIGSFQPSPGNYILSLWVKEDVTPLPQTYNNAKVEINFLGVTGSTPITVSTNGVKNKIIDGWQRIEEQFTIPPTATNLKLKLRNDGTNDTYFDDIRVFPVDGQMKTYVYDPVTLRLTATLDENNYATFYEYDEEGKLIRVKKETEKGIMTIQESREGNKKK